MTVHSVDLKERIAISDAFTPEERDLILDALNYFLAAIKTADVFNYESISLPHVAADA